VGGAIFFLPLYEFFSTGWRDWTNELDDGREEQMFGAK
jgi:hypothetical protein